MVASSQCVVRLKE